MAAKKNAWIVNLNGSELEPQEVKGLTETSDLSKGKVRSSQWGRSNFRSRCGFFLLMATAIALFSWVMTGNTNLESNEGAEGSRMMDIREKAEEPATDAAPPKASAKDSNTMDDTTGGSTLEKRDSWLPKPYTVRTENPPSPAVLEEYAKTWGTWKLGELPKMDRSGFCGGQSHCDVPREKIPADAWQNDSAYMSKFLEEADSLVGRAMNAILAEYGKSPSETAMFDLSYKDFGRRDLRGKGPPSNGGWTTKRSMQGLARRLLHAMMTRDTFTFVLGGHSAAAGHGNNFKQSYSMQFHKVMEPVLSYLGVQLISRNMGQGGLGTAQSSLAFHDIYGDEIDFMIWDSGMTEGRDTKAVDLFGRQALMGHRVPVLWNLNGDLLQMYHEHCDADVGILGTGDMGIPLTTSEAQAQTLPYASRYMKCEGESAGLCQGNNKYNAVCWVDRPDVTPPQKQSKSPGSQVQWHPGFRTHQLAGRVLAYTVLLGLKEAIQIWKNADAYALSDEDWHVTAYYDNIRNKVMNLDPALGSCGKYKDSITGRVCNVPMRGRTEYTPRANPELTSVRSILKTGGNVPSVMGEILYDGPDVRIPAFDIPEGHVDVLAILNNGRHFPDDDRTRRLSIERRSSDEIVPGKGLELRDHPEGYCDGSYNAVCRRERGSGCLLYGHHDGRAAINFDGLSGWVVLEVPKVKHGIIAAEVQSWLPPGRVSITKDWKTANNEVTNEQRNLRTGQVPNYVEDFEGRRLGQKPFCKDFFFDFAVDGKITSYNATEFSTLSHRGNIQRTLEVYTFLDDPEYVKDGEEKDVEVAIRIRGCGRDNTFGLTHVHWA